MTMRWELRLLGPPWFAKDGTTVQLPYRKATALVAAVAAERHPWTRERLRTLLWGEQDEHRAADNFRHALHSVTKHLPGALFTRGDLVGLERGLVDLDLDRLPGAVAAEEVLSLRRGLFCEGLEVRDSPDFDDWLNAQRSRWDGQCLATLLGMAETQATAGQLADALRSVRAALDVDPLHEAAHGRAIDLLVRMGNRSAAQAQALECRRVLWSELGVEPSASIMAPLQDRRDPVPHSASASAPRPLPSSSPPAPLIGRDDEMAAMDDAHARARSSGRARLWVVEGEAGVGKTRLVEEWLAGHREADVLRSKAFQAEAALPLAIWSEALGTADPLTGTTARSASWAPDPRALPDVVLAELTRRSRARPLVIFLDDLQWADSASLALLSYAVRRGGDRLFFVATARKCGLGPLATLTAELRREDRCDVLSLSPLKERDVMRLADTMLGSALSAAQQRRLFTDTGGNPLIVVETLRARQRGLAPSQLLRDFLEPRLAGLSERSIHFLGLAAVVGRDFDPGLLERVAQADPEAMLDALDEWIRLDLVRERERDLLDFTSDPLRDLVLQRLPLARQRFFHRRVAQVLEAAGSDPARIARHFEAAGLAAQALPWRLEAIQGARRSGAHGTALEMCGSARRLLEGADAPTEVPSMVGLDGHPVIRDPAAIILYFEGECRFSLGDARGSEHAFRELATRGRALGDRALEVASGLALLELGTLRDQRPIQPRQFEELITLAEACGDRVGLARVWLAWGTGALDRGEWSDARHRLRRSLRLARPPARS